MEHTSSGSRAETLEPWKIHVDGSSNQEARRIRVVLDIGKEERVEFGVKLEYPATSNETEYEALIVGLLSAELLRGEYIVIYCDSRLVVSEMAGKFEA